MNKDPLACVWLPIPQVKYIKKFNVLLGLGGSQGPEVHERDLNSSTREGCERTGRGYELTDKKDREYSSDDRTGLKG